MEIIDSCFEKKKEVTTDRNLFIMTKIVVILLIILSIPSSSSAKVYPEGSYRVKVLEALPHDIKAYTQGLFFHEGRLYESSGQYGESFFREMDIKRGTTLRSFSLQSKYFAEGATVIDNRLYLLTWMEKTVFVYDINTFKQLGTLHNPREGWGLTTDGKQLIMSDGTSTIYFLDPMTFKEIRKITVSQKGKKTEYLNELEYIGGYIWANVYESDTIVIIDPTNGNVRSTIDCRGLLHSSLKNSKTDVLNGIAYNPDTGDIYLTGKYWPRMFRVDLVKQ